MRPDHLYTHRTPSGRYVYSVRAGNNKSNSLDRNTYNSRSGRNFAVNKVIAAYKERKKPLTVHRNEKPPK